MYEEIEKYLTEKNGDSKFIKDIVEYLWIMPVCESIEETLEKLEKWIGYYRFENQCSENIDFPSVDVLSALESR